MYFNKLFDLFIERLLNSFKPGSAIRMFVIVHPGVNNFIDIFITPSVD